MKGNSYEGEATLTDEDGNQITTSVRIAVRRGQLTSWQGTAIVEGFTDFEPGAGTIRLEGGEEGAILVNNVRTVANPIGSQSVIDFLGNGPAPGES